MKKIILLAAFLFVVTTFMPLDAQWVKIYGDSDRDDAYFIQQTSDGGYVVAGGTHSDGRLMVLKLDSNGSVEWKSAYYDSYYKNPVSFLQMSDGGYIFAFHAGMNDPDDDYKFKDELLITKLTQDGVYVSTGSIGRFINNNEYAKVFQPTDDGGYVLAGDTQTYGVGEYDIWVSKLTSAGDIEWQRTYGGSDNDSLNSIKNPRDGGYVLASDTRSFGSSEEDILVLKLTSAGDVEWQRTYGGGYSDKACSVKQTSDGGYVLAGNTQSFGAGGGDVWIIKLTNLGDIEWQQAYGGSGDDSVSSIQQTADGSYVFGGTTNSFGEGGGDFWIMKLSAAGDIDWQKTFGTSSGEISHALQQTNDGGYIAAGTISSYGSGSSDFLVLKLLQDGNIDSPCKFLQDSSAQVAVTTVSPTDTSINPLYSDVIRELVDPNLYSYFTEAVEYELCSENPLLAIHSTSGGTTDPPPGTSTHMLGEGVTVTAIPEDGDFTGWSGDAIGLDNPITITMDSDKSIASNFFINEYMLYITAGEGGTTDPEPGIHKDAPGTDIVVTAIPEGGYQFNEWSGDITGTENPVTITLDSNKSVAANFTEISDEGGDIFRINCFVATAAYGSPLHPHVKVLRDFRDEYLMPSKLGRKLVNIYYRYSPFLASVITRHMVLKVAVRRYLLPLVVFSYSMVHLGPLFTSIILFLILTLQIFLIVFWQEDAYYKNKKINMIMANRGTRI